MIPTTFTTLTPLSYLCTPAIWACCQVVQLRFASDGILCAKTFIGEIIESEFDWFVEEPNEEGRGVKFPRKSAILADYTTITDGSSGTTLSGVSKKSDFPHFPGSEFTGHNRKFQADLTDWILTI